LSLRNRAQNVGTYHMQDTDDKSLKQLLILIPRSSTLAFAFSPFKVTRSIVSASSFSRTDIVYEQPDLF
jgi:hypothetical protein